MNTVKALNDLQKFIKEEVTCKIKLKCPDDTNVNNYKLVHPSVFTGWLPPKGYLPSDLESTIPCIVVGADSINDSNKNASIDIKLSFATYSPGEYYDEITPSFNGYIDLLNLIDITKAELMKNKIIYNKYKIEDDIYFEMYEEQPYPYWYGYMKFKINGQSYPMTNIEKNL